MAIDYADVRQQLTDIVTSGLPEDSDARVYPGPPETEPGEVSVIVGQPNVTGFDSQPCIDSVDWPVAVLVAPGASGNYRRAQQRLEALWPVVAEALRSATEQGDLVRVGNVVGAELARAEFGDFSISGLQYPAQVIHLTLHG